MLVAIVSTLGCATGRAAPAPAPATQAPTAQTQSAPKPDSTSPTPPGAGALSAPNADPFPSTYRPVASRPVAIRNATIMTAAGPTIQNGTIVLRDGKIVAVGANVPVPPDAQVVDGSGKFVTPGMIDTHSHLGVYAAPGGDALSDGNEMSSPSTPNVWAEHSVWPQDPQFPRALSAGVTTIQILPGSANLFGGRSVVLKVVPSRTVQGMKFPGAKYGLKMACGENPKRVYAQRGLMTRMGNVAGYRAQWINAEAYRRRWDKWLAGDRKGDPPSRDLAMETLSEVLRGNILVHNHLLPKLGDKKVATLTPDAIRTFYRSTPLAPSSIKVLHTILRYALPPQCMEGVGIGIGIDPLSRFFGESDELSSGSHRVTR